MISICKDPDMMWPKRRKSDLVVRPGGIISLSLGCLMQTCLLAQVTKVAHLKAKLPRLPKLPKFPLAAQYGMGPYTQKRAQKAPEAPAAPTSVPIRIIRYMMMIMVVMMISQPYRTEFLLRNVFYPSKFGAFYVYFQPVSPARTA